MARIVVAMSGGVDSSVAAALLKEEGHEVIGMMLRLWSEPGVIEDDGVVRIAQNKCCSLESVDDARRVARKLDIPFYLVNVEQEFKENVVDYFYQEYVAGRTPNPCLTCNRHIRFTLLLNRALSLDAEYLATGHYVRADTDPLTGKRRLRRGLDREKDQSYVLHVLNQKQLTHACFPLGPYTKPQVRAMAAERGMTVASKPESQEICFVAQDDYRGFIDRYAVTLADKEPVGIRATTQANGLIQLHVLKIDSEQNALIVGPAKELDKTSCTVSKMHYISGETPSKPFNALARIRYKAPEQEAVITPLDGQRARVTFSHPQRAITPGQAAVFYGGEDEVLCGGIIESDTPRP